MTHSDRHYQKYLDVCLYVCSFVHQIIENVSLVDMDGDQRLIFGPLVPAQLSSRHVDELIEEVQELLIGRLHDLTTNKMGAVRREE